VTELPETIRQAMNQAVFTDTGLEFSDAEYKALEAAILAAIQEARTFALMQAAAIADDVYRRCGAEEWETAAAVIEEEIRALLPQESPHK